MDKLILTAFRTGTPVRIPAMKMSEFAKLLTQLKKDRS